MFNPAKTLTKVSDHNKLFLCILNYWIFYNSLLTWWLSRPDVQAGRLGGSCWCGVLCKFYRCSCKKIKVFNKTCLSLLDSKAVEFSTFSFGLRVSIATGEFWLTPAPCCCKFKQFEETKSIIILQKFIIVLNEEQFFCYILWHFYLI